MLVIFAGRFIDSAFRHTICKRLSEKAKICEISSGKIACEQFPSDFTLIFEKTPIKINAKDYILILNGCTTAQSITGEKYCIVNSHSSDDTAIAKESLGEVITCGMSIRDSVTFSSFTSDGCVLSLQRRLKDFNGRQIDPFELPLCYDESENRFGILCANLLLILGGYI